MVGRKIKGGDKPAIIVVDTETWSLLLRLREMGVAEYKYRDECRK